MKWLDDSGHMNSSSYLSCGSLCLLQNYSWYLHSFSDLCPPSRITDLWVIASFGQSHNSATFFPFSFMDLMDYSRILKVLEYLFYSQILIVTFREPCPNIDLTAPWSSECGFIWVFSYRTIQKQAY